MDEAPAPETHANLPEFSVSELSAAIKNAVEERFPYVRVRGELGRVSRPSSGHCYFELKDERAVLSAVVWKGTYGRLKVKPEQGLEVVCTGRITTFQGQSRYQMVVEQMELAGAGALMAMLEERRKKLAAEGLFDDARKQAIPFLPAVIGVVTSPTGAVIRDIMHRLADRFPRRVLLWPVRVQGESAAAEIAAAIEGFNALSPGGAIPRPDVLIVARGGGSVEDLMAFNEEIVVRAAAASMIPLISAVGHETDTTLIDFASDRRAPTPTAAAEMAVPVRAELLDTTIDFGRRMMRASARLQTDRRQRLQGLARSLPRADALFAMPRQRFDTAADKLKGALRQNVHRHAARFREAAALLRPRIVSTQLAQGRERAAPLAGRLARGYRRRLEEAARALEGATRILETVSYRSVLARGFALVAGDGGLKRRAAEIRPGERLWLRFADGETPAVASGGPGAPAQPRRKPGGQGSLF